MINEYLLEPFLTEYYLLEAVCGPHMSSDEKKKMFYELASVFCLSECDELASYYSESNKEPFCLIFDLPAYERLCRTIEFAEKSGQDIALSERDRMILSQKREAMLIKSEHLKLSKNMTKESCASGLLSMAMNGNIDAMTCLSYMEYHGICTCRDTLTAKKRTRHAAKWNSLFGNLMGIAYDKENKEKYYNTLYTVLRGESRKTVFEHIRLSGNYRGKTESDPIARMIERAFSLGTIKRNIYDQLFSKIAFSDMISQEDKEKLLLTKQKDAILSLSELPFDVVRTPKIEFDSTVTDRLPFAREAEVGKILRNITVARACPVDVYKPLLVVSPDAYVVDTYREMLKSGFSDASVVEIDAGTLTSQDFAGNKENIFLRGLSETKTARTVFIIKDCEELGERELEELLKVLDGGYRKKFKLFSPTVSFDLSGIVFALFAVGRGENITALSDVCDTVCAKRVSEDEKAAVAEAIFKSRTRSYGYENITTERGCMEFLTGFDSAKMQQVINAAITCAIFKESDTITLDTLKKVCAEENISVSDRVFGYKGGEKHA